MNRDNREAIHKKSLTVSYTKGLILKFEKKNSMIVLASGESLCFNRPRSPGTGHGHMCGLGTV